jgi:Tol biopolymer transport system component
MTEGTNMTTINTPSRLTWVTATLLICLAATTVSAKKGGGGGKPGGGEPAVQTLAYSSAGVHLVAEDGSNDQNLGNRNASRVNWSPDGSKLAFWDDGPKGIYTMNADGSGRTLVITAITTYHEGHGIEWSPDGNHLVFDDSRAPGEAEVVWVANADGSDRTQLSPGAGSYGEILPSYSPTGDAIAYKGAGVIVAWLSPDGKGIIAEESITEVEGSPLQGRPVWGLQWCKVSACVLVSVSPDPDPTLSLRRIWRVDLQDPANPTPLTSPEVNGGANQPSFNADESKLAYESLNSRGKHAIFVANPDGSSPLEIGNSRKSKHYAAFRRDQ